MNIFLSWSGEQSKKIAKIISEYLPYILNYVKPYYSADDILKGKLWSGDIAKRLEGYHFGILCLTHENLKSPWMHFEAGALAKNINVANVCPLLLGVPIADVANPLSLFQTTHFEREDFKKLIDTINISDSEYPRLAQNIVDRNFNSNWEELYEKVSLIINNEVKIVTTNNSYNDKILEEILSLVKDLSFNKNQDKIYTDIVGQLIDTTYSHLTWTVDNKPSIDVNTFKAYLIPFEYLISKISSKNEKDGIISKYELLKVLL